MQQPHTFKCVSEKLNYLKRMGVIKKNLYLIKDWIPGRGKKANKQKQNISIQ